MKIEDIKSIVHDLQDDMVAIRRDIHQHPELAWQEHRTAGVIARRLETSGLEVRTGVAETGVIGLLRGGAPGPTIGIRADIDAYPEQEATGEPYASKVPGVFHGCGHDAHVAMALGAADALSQVRSRLHGNVKLLFEPAEEAFTKADKPSGAQMFIDEGVVDDLDFLLGMHVWGGETRAGHLLVADEAVFSGVDVLKITVLGEEVHVALGRGVDALVAAAHVVTALQTIPSRDVDAREPYILHLASIHGGKRDNIVAGRVEIRGSVRGTNIDLRRRMRDRIEEVVDNVTRAFGASYEMDYEEFLLPLVNSPEFAKRVRESATRVLGADLVHKMDVIMSGDTFVDYCGVVPVCYTLLGCANPDKGITGRPHDPDFDIDEDCMEVGTLVQVATCVDYLKG